MMRARRMGARCDPAVVTQSTSLRLCVCLCVCLLWPARPALPFRMRGTDPGVLTEHDEKQRALSHSEPLFLLSPPVSPHRPPPPPPYSVSSPCLSGRPLLFFYCTNTLADFLPIFSLLKLKPFFSFYTFSPFLSAQQP